MRILAAHSDMRTHTTSTHETHPSTKRPPTYKNELPTATTATNKNLRASQHTTGRHSPTKQKNRRGRDATSCQLRTEQTPGTPTSQRPCISESEIDTASNDEPQAARGGNHWEKGWGNSANQNKFILAHKYPIGGNSESMCLEA